MKSLSVSEFFFFYMWSQENNASCFDKTEIIPRINKFIPHSQQLVLLTYRQRILDSVFESF